MNRQDIKQKVQLSLSRGKTGVTVSNELLLEVIEQADAASMLQTDLNLVKEQLQDALENFKDLEEEVRSSEHLGEAIRKFEEQAARANQLALELNKTKVAYDELKQEFDELVERTGGPM